MTERDDSTAEQDTAFRPTSERPAEPRRSASRFTPGTVLGDRYRVVALLGSGGMGEVYRAEDLKLGQQVALKFLPQRVAEDPRRIERLYAEVRIGRQVSHPNVCRLYDIGEWEGHHFLAMEYVDGEDLASLLRRIGKLPHDKAIDLARDICAGLAAAHGLGIVHRDLKPANVMIDGRGQARITDFGLAAVAEELRGQSEVVGTPLYMAPEQLTGENVSPKTDLYALGLILYEMFTGRRLFESAPSDMNARRSITRSHSLSSQTREIDPAIQRVILRCLEEEPEARPASIHSVIAALPGGDPLQAAMDAGETPSPQMVAAAGAVGDLQPSVAWALLAGAIVTLIIGAVLYGRNVLFRRVTLPKEPAVLIERARNVIEKAGYREPPADAAFGFTMDGDFSNYVRKQTKRGDPWEAVARSRPGIFIFGYRQSPRPLVAAATDGRVTFEDPPKTIPGMTEVFLDTQGRLLSFSAVPPQTRSGSANDFDWSAFFAEAGGDFENMRPVPPVWTPSFHSDRHLAWQANYRGHSIPIRIEAASHAGRPVWFDVIGPWRKPMQGKPDAQPLPRRILRSAGFFLFVLAPFVGGIVLARRNLRRGRGDRRGAARIAMFVFGCRVAAALFRIDHVRDFDAEWDLLSRVLAFSLFEGAFVWILYLALEPYIRRRWPHLMIGWSRLLSGRWRDPMVGRDVLVGVTAGLIVGSLRLASVEIPTWFGAVALDPLNRWVSPLASVRHLAYLCLRAVVDYGITLPMILAMLLILFLVIFRRRHVAIAALWLIGALFINDFGEPMAWRVGVGAIMATLVIGVMIRYGLLAAAFVTLVEQLISSAPITLDPSDWYFGRSLAVLLAILAIAAYGFYVSLGEKAVFALPALDEA